MSYFDLGSYSRKVSTNSAEAQVWFDRGLNWLFGFNHGEAVKCFKKATEHDPECAMAYWGIAYASGCNYNKEWKIFGKKERVRAVATCHRTTAEAMTRLDGATKIERALIQALEQRYQSDQVVSKEEFKAWNDDYSAAMKLVYEAFPDDLDVSCLYAEAMINRTPWRLWDLKLGQPAEGADTVEAMQVLERAIALAEERGDDAHPGLLHIYIHVMEMSPFPERALRAADILRDLVPDGGHLRHMPSHIDILCGHYYEAVVANNKAIVADEKYLAYKGPFNFYTTYRIHDYHFKLYAAMFLGQYKTAIDTADDMLAAIPDKLLRIEQPPMADWLEGLLSVRLHVLIRFGKWQTILDEAFPEDSLLYSVTTAMLHYAKGLAHAARGEVDAAEEQKTLFTSAFANVPDTRYVFNNKCLDLLAIANEMLNGEIEYRKGNYEQAFAYLKQSIELDDNLPYAEPWGWMQPTRHALGALLLEQGHIAEAEQIYRADLGLDNTLSRASQHPENVWSLHGYVECLNRQNKQREAAAMQTRLDLALARADVEINASCFCRVGKSCCG